MIETDLQKESSLSRAKDDNDYSRLLLDRIARGSETALAEFYRLYEARVYAFAQVRLNERHEAADLLNEVMWEVWKGAGRFQGRSSVTTWLFGIANHKVIDRLRRRGKPALEDLEQMRNDAAEFDLDEVANRMQVKEHLLCCLEKLSDAQRKVVHLAYFEDLSYREIGEIVGSAEGTIKARMFHAKQSLKRCLARRIM